MRKLVTSAACVVVLSGCSGPPRPLPKGGVAERPVAPEALEAARREQQADTTAALSALSRRMAQGAAPNILVLSSGGQSGAFGAGLIEGWGASGSRPEFDLVTGSSTGSLIAVFAFLGAAGDGPLRAMYTSHATSDVYTPYPWVSILASSAYASSTPLRATIRKYIDAAVVKAVAREAKRGRVLEVCTTNLDLGEMRVWNLTALAADESRPMDDRVERFREIVVASLSIPSLVPPVFIDGCMHADGALTRQLFLPDLEHGEDLAGILTGKNARVWVVINRRMGSPARMIRNQIIPITARTVQVMIDAALVRDLDEVHRFADRIGGTFAAASLPLDPGRKEPEGFLDASYMKEVHALGFRLGSEAKAWDAAVKTGGTVVHGP